MPLISDSEMEDFDAAILQAGFEVSDFSVVDVEDEPTAIEQLEAETAIEQHVPTGTVTIRRISTDDAITFTAGSDSIWPQAFEADLQAGKFGQPSI